MRTAQTYKIKSSFAESDIEIFIYRNENSKKYLLYMKGLYGYHSISDESIEKDIIESHKNSYSVIAINTSKLPLDNKETKEAFEGKLFIQESEDYVTSINYILENIDNDLFGDFSIVANSFGGTVLMAIPELIKKSKNIIMIGSGCSKSDTTTKPLLVSMVQEGELLFNLSQYKGNFYYVRGELDEVVPNDSQVKVLRAAVNARTSLFVEIERASHNLKIISNKDFNRGELLLRLL